LLDSDGNLWPSERTAVQANSGAPESRAKRDARDAELTRLRRLLSTSPGVLYICRASGDYGASFVSENVRQQLGYSPEEFVADAAFWASRIHPEDEAQVFGALVALFEHGQHRHEYRFLHQDGRYRWLHDDMRLIRDEDGGPLEIAGCWMDITDRRLGEEALQLSEERHRVVARVTNDVLWSWDVKENVFEFSESLARKFGYDSVEPTFEWWAERVHPSDRPRVVSELERALSSNASEWSDRYRCLRGDGTIAEVVDRGAILRNPDGSVRRMAGAICDVTEQNRLQRQVIHTDRLAAVGTLAAGVGHEINNPLAYVISNVKFAVEELANARQTSLSPEQVDEIRQALLEAEQGAERVRRIVQDLKLFACAENANAERVPVERPLASAINMAMHEIRRRATLVKQLAPGVFVRADEARLGQVFLNLLVNAAQAVPEGASERNRITITTRNDASGHAVIEVSDTGQGIAPEHIGQIFNPFFTTKPLGEGTGLGLSISHQIVTQLGGTISVESRLGKGTTFCVKLPAEHPAPKALASVLPRMLIVDDDPGVSNGMRRLLSRSFAVETVTSSTAALELLRRGARFELILCDLMMPELTGMQLHESVARELVGVAERFVFMTAGVFTASAQTFLARVPNACLEKPVNLETLRTVARQMLASGSPGPRSQRPPGLRRALTPGPISIPRHSVAPASG